MQQETVASVAGPGTDRTSTYRTTRRVLRVGFGVQAGLGVTQPVLAGSYLSGNLDAIDIHSAIGGLFAVVAFGALILALVHWYVGRGPGWPAGVMAVLVVLVSVQATAGYARSLGLHVPLGVGLVTSVVALFGWSLFGRDRIRPARVSAAAPAAAPETTGFAR